jgi:hypothetical protein
MLRFGLVLVIGWSLSLGTARAQDPVQKTLNLKNETEAGAALLFLELHNRGLAGGKTGVCVDLDYDAAGEPRFKAAFDTNAFVTGKCDLKSGGEFNIGGFQNLVSAIAKAQKNKVKVSVDGYADGQHYGGKTLEDSIKANEDLSKCRSDLIAGVIGKDQENVNLEASRGHASPYWERKSPPPAAGLNCPTRRKVVVTFDQKTPTIENQMSGNFFGAPASMSPDVKSAIRKKFNTSVSAAKKALKIEPRSRNLLNGGGIDRDVKSIYDRLKTEGRLNPKCDLPPFKQVTEAMIENLVFRTDKVRALNRKLGEAGFETKNIDGGVSALQEGCLMPDASLDQSISAGSKDFKTSGASMMGSSSLKSRDGMVEVGFDVATLDAPKVKTGIYKGKSVRGFFCQACGNGLYFFPDPANPGKFIPEYHDRLVKFDPQDAGKRKAFMDGLNALSEADPFGAAAFLKPRLFVVKNCPDCSCDAMGKVRSKDPGVISFDPVAGVDGKVNLPAAEFEKACVLRPPVHHACNVQPVKNDGKDQKTFSEELEYRMVLDDLKVKAPNLPALLNQVNQSCSKSSGTGLTAEQKIADVLCANHPGLKLPSEDEEADCLDFAK